MYEQLCLTKIERPLENWLVSEMKLNNTQNEEFGLNHARVFDVKEQIFKEEKKIGKQQCLNQNIKNLRRKSYQDCMQKKRQQMNQYSN